VVVVFRVVEISLSPDLSPILFAFSPGKLLTLPKRGFAMEPKLLTLSKYLKGVEVAAGDCPKVPPPLDVALAARVPNPEDLEPENDPNTGTEVPDPKVGAADAGVPKIDLEGEAGGGPSWGSLLKGGVPDTPDPKKKEQAYQKQI
jgi:hypothetical protein